MSTESLKRTSDEIKISNYDLYALKQDKSKMNNSKRTCINTLKQRLYSENRKDKNKSIIIVCVIVFSIGIFGFIIT